MNIQKAILMKLSIRKKGLIKFILGSIGFAIVFQYLLPQLK